MRTTAEIVADLRERARRPGGLAEEAADRLTEQDAEVAAVAAALPDCPRCGGTGEVRGMNHTSPAEPLFPCPDCDHGRVTVEQLVERLAAVNAALDQHDGRNADDVRWAIAKAVGR